MEEMINKVIGVCYWNWNI